MSQRQNGIKKEVPQEQQRFLGPQCPHTTGKGGLGSSEGKWTVHGLLLGGGKGADQS